MENIYYDFVGKTLYSFIKSEYNGWYDEAVEIEPMDADYMNVGCFVPVDEFTEEEEQVWDCLTKSTEFTFNPEQYKGLVEYGRQLSDGDLVQYYIAIPQ